MIQFTHEAYGQVVIYEPMDVTRDGMPLGETSFVWDDEISKFPMLRAAGLVAFRHRRKNKVKLIKNRYGPLHDVMTENFILNYRHKKEVFDPIESRFDILDL